MATIGWRWTDKGGGGRIYEKGRPDQRRRQLLARARIRDVEFRPAIAPLAVVGLQPDLIDAGRRRAGVYEPRQAAESDGLIERDGAPLLVRVPSAGAP